MGTAFTYLLFSFVFILLAIITVMQTTRFKDKFQDDGKSVLIPWKALVYTFGYLLAAFMFLVGIFACIQSTVEFMTAAS